jgi:hypothetical protein
MSGNDALAAALTILIPAQEGMPKIGLLKEATLITKLGSWSNTLPPYGNKIRKES